MVKYYFPPWRPDIHCPYYPPCFRRPCRAHPGALATLPIPFATLIPPSHPPLSNDSVARPTAARHVAQCTG